MPQLSVATERMWALLVCPDEWEVAAALPCAQFVRITCIISS